MIYNFLSYFSGQEPDYIEEGLKKQAGEQR
jgi:hypothetical protein